MLSIIGKAQFLFPVFLCWGSWLPTKKTSQTAQFISIQFLRVTICKIVKDKVLSNIHIFIESQILYDCFFVQFPPNCCWLKFLENMNIIG